MRVPQSWPGEQDQNNEVINSSSLSDRYNTTTLTGGMGYTYKGIHKQLGSYLYCEGTHYSQLQGFYNLMASQYRHNSLVSDSEIFDVNSKLICIQKISCD